MQADWKSDAQQQVNLQHLLHQHKFGLVKANNREADSERLAGSADAKLEAGAQIPDKLKVVAAVVRLHQLQLFSLTEIKI